MYVCVCRYAPREDPFLSLPNDELIGVAYLYPDALQYMLDIDEYLPIVNFKGYSTGGIQILVRAWVDKIEIAPEYLSADMECRIDNYINHKLIIRLFFESLKDLPPKLCCYNHISFKFFNHITPYR